MALWSVLISANVETYTRLKKSEFTVKCTETQMLVLGELGPNKVGKDHEWGSMVLQKYTKVEG